MAEHPVPWKVQIVGVSAHVIDAERNTVTTFDPDDAEFWHRIVKAVNNHHELVKALRAFVSHATYPVSTEINPRGYAWRGEEALDYAKGLADAVLGDVGKPAHG